MQQASTFRYKSIFHRNVNLFFSKTFKYLTGETSISNYSISTQGTNLKIAKKRKSFNEITPNAYCPTLEKIMQLGLVPQSY